MRSCAPPCTAEDRRAAPKKNFYGYRVSVGRRQRRAVPTPQPGTETDPVSYPNRLQRLILDRLVELSRAEQQVVTDEEAARRCGMNGSTFSNIIREDKGNRQIVHPKFLPQIAEGLNIPLESLLDAAAFAAGYRRESYNESDLLSVVRFWLTDDLSQYNVREAMRMARDDLQKRLDDWAERRGQ